MAQQRPGVVRRLLCGIWDTLNFTRRLIVNVIFVALLVLVLGLMFPTRLVLLPRTALVLDPTGAIVEQYSTDPSQRALGSLFGDGAKEVQLRDLLRAIDGATKDAHIERIVLVPDDIGSAGFAVMAELGAALDRFRAAGKDVVVVSDGMNQMQYALAAHADEILLDPDGAVVLEGLSSYRSYFHEALDKLGVQVHLIRVGQFKSAAEPFILDAASDAAKQADQYWMGGIWQNYLTGIAGLRKIDAAGLSDDIAHYDERVTAHGGDLAKLALDQKLVDQLTTRAQARAYLRGKGVAAADGDSFRQIAYKDYLALVARELPSAAAQVGVIVAQGEIVPGDQPQGVVGGKSTAALIRKAREDDRIKALVLRVDSPGGDVSASEVVRREVAQTRAAGKPVVVSMGNVAASGGYWISMNANRIFAQPETISGSIGIFGLFVTVPDTLAKLGIHNDGIGTTPLAGAFDVRRPFSPQLETILGSVIGRGYQQFIGKVAEARDRTPEQIDAIAQGRVWTGSQAKDRGLVDELGGLEQAIAAAAGLANLGSDFQVQYVEKQLTPWERMALNFGNSEAMVGTVRALGLQLPLGLLRSDELGQLKAVAESLRGKRYAAFAHCFCALP